MGREEQINRIKEMEDRYNACRSCLEQLEKAVGIFEQTLTDYKILSDYYAGPLWLADYEDDEKGLIPDGLRRGVLSEDGLYDLLNEYKQMMIKIGSKG